MNKEIPIEQKMQTRSYNSDRGEAVIIMGSENYVAEYERQLSNLNNYKKLPNDLTQKLGHWSTIQ